MVDTPHSLTFQPRATSPASRTASPAFGPVQTASPSPAPGSNRNSVQMTQLPLPSASQPLQRLSGTYRTSVPGSPARSSSPSQVRIPSASINNGGSEITRSPTMPTFSFSHPPSFYSTTSNTHAGGIQPSASFFRPARPAQPPSNGVRSTSVFSSTEQDMFQLSSLSRPASISSGTGGGADSTILEEEHDAQPQASQNTSTRSRDPLLPMGVVRRRGSAPGATGRRSPMSPRRLMRTSLEKVITLSRGMSFDSSRKTARTATTSEEDERKIGDEEQVLYPPIPTRRAPTSASPSHDPSFVFDPTPAQRAPPLAAVPVIDTRTNKPVRNYQGIPSQSRFYCNGHILTGGETPYAFLGCLTVFFSIAGFWFGTTCPWWWHHKSPAVAAVGAYLALVTAGCMFYTAFSDPGILPRNLDPDPPYPTTSPSDGGGRVPLPRDIMVREAVIRVKYCTTCMTYRPPRSSHCRMCDNCVDACDHHCQWVNNCVGRRNYTTFFALLVMELLLVIVTSALHIYFVAKTEGVDFREALHRAWGSTLNFCLSLVVLFPVSLLFGYHIQLRHQAHKSLMPGEKLEQNPYSYGSWRRNMMAALCRPTGYSWIGPHEIATEDQREVNPGIVARDRATDRSGTDKAERTGWPADVER
ncbi:zf-DHHC-domain-containing protein [Fistulina hepatica ATCC 64428]|nr:zf-DHHC-domain-containing protein [Fistulina hepatica ATCC 64428]